MLGGRRFCRLWQSHESKLHLLWNGLIWRQSRDSWLCVIGPDCWHISKLSDRSPWCCRKRGDFLLELGSLPVTQNHATLLLTTNAESADSSSMADGPFYFPGGGTGPFLPGSFRNFLNWLSSIFLVFFSSACKISSFDFPFIWPPSFFLLDSFWTVFRSLSYLREYCFLYLPYLPQNIMISPSHSIAWCKCCNLIDCASELAMTKWRVMQYGRVFREKRFLLPVLSNRFWKLTLISFYYSY